MKPRFGPPTRPCLSHRGEGRIIVLGVRPKPSFGWGPGPVCRRPPTLFCQEEFPAWNSRTGHRPFLRVEGAAKTSPGPAWHSEFKGDMSGEKFPLDRFGPKEYFLAGCYPSDSLVNPLTSPSTFRSVVWEGFSARCRYEASRGILNPRGGFFIEAAWMVIYRQMAQGYKFIQKERPPSYLPTNVGLHYSKHQKNGSPIIFSRLLKYSEVRRLNSQCLCGFLG